nr:hypothetical protein BaRGS_012164 [Batillaria attramentaria]
MSTEGTTEITEITSWIEDDHLGNRSNVSAPEGCITLQLRAFEFIPWDNPDNLMSYRTEKLFDVIVAAGFLYVLFLVSAPTNIISMIAFYKQGIKERINLCLFAQSFADLVYMTFNFLLYADRLYFEIKNGSRRVVMAEIMLNNYLVGLYGFSWASGFMAMIIANFVPWDNPENLISQEVERAFDTVTVVFLYILFLISAPTNIISMIAFYKQGRKLESRLGPNICAGLFSWPRL